MKIQTVKIISILIKCICLHACSVCEDIVGKHGEVAEWQTHEEYWNFTQPEGLLKSESSSRFESGLFHINVSHTLMAWVNK